MGQLTSMLKYWAFRKTDKKIKKQATYTLRKKYIHIMKDTFRIYKFLQLNSNIQIICTWYKNDQ